MKPFDRLPGDSIQSEVASRHSKGCVTNLTTE